MAAFKTPEMPARGSNGKEGSNGQAEAGNAERARQNAVIGNMRLGNKKGTYLGVRGINIRGGLKRFKTRRVHLHSLWRFLWPKISKGNPI